MADNSSLPMNIKIPRMRTVADAVKELKALDENTAVTEYYVRSLAVTGAIPRVKSGKKYLINLDSLIEHLSGSNCDCF